MFLHQKPDYEKYVAASRHAKKVLEYGQAGISLSVDLSGVQKRNEQKLIRDPLRTDDIQGKTSKYV